MKTKRLLRKWWVWLLLIIGFLLIIISLLSSSYFNPWLQDKLEATVREQSKGLYRLHLHGLHASLLSGSIRADSIHLQPDFDAWEQRNKAAGQDTAKQSAAPHMLADLKWKEMQISGINFLGVLRGRPLDVNLLRVTRPQVVITQMRPDTTGQQEPLHASLEGIAKDLKIKRMEVQNGSLRLRERKDTTTNSMTLDSLSLLVDDLRLDSASLHDQNRAYYARRIAVETGKASFLAPDGIYRLQAANLKADTEEGTLSIGQLQLIPLLKNAEQARRTGEAATTIRLSVPEIRASGVDFGLHARKGNLAVAGIVARRPSLSAYMDRKHHQLKTEKPLPHDLIQNLKTGLHIQKIEVQGMFIQYEELAPDAVETGKLTFQNLHATITNLTNDKNRMSQQKSALVKVKTNINGDVPLAVTFRFNLLDPAAYHHITGTAGPANPASLNTILEPTTFLSVKEGKLQKSDFEIALRRSRASGNLNVRYSDLKVDVLTADEDTRQSLGKKVLSKLANKLLVNSDNPDGDEALRPGEIAVVRARTRSVFNYWKDCLVSGFRSAAGVEGIGQDLTDPQR